MMWYYEKYHLLKSIKIYWTSYRRVEKQDKALSKYWINWVLLHFSSYERSPGVLCILRLVCLQIYNTSPVLRPWMKMWKCWWKMWKATGEKCGRSGFERLTGDIKPASALKLQKIHWHLPHLITKYKKKSIIQMYAILWAKATLKQISCTCGTTYWSKRNLWVSIFITVKQLSFILNFHILFPTFIVNVCPIFTKI